MAEQSFDVRGVDQKGEIVIDRTVSTLRNGFMELWLPRERVISLSIRQGELAAEGTIETFEKSKTCVTTFQLR